MELYHVLNRGVDKRAIVTGNSDRLRFVHDMFEFNDTKPAGNAYRDFDRHRINGPGTARERDREPLVKIHAWCLMDNHYHLLLEEAAENGVRRFMRKINVGYARYFNEKHKRTGALFEGRSKMIAIEREAHFLYILHYIHLNPLDYLKNAHEWRERRIRNTEEAMRHLSRYRWSSYLDYCGTRNIPSILTTELFNGVFRNYEKEIRDYLSDLQTLDKAYTLE